MAQPGTCYMRNFSSCVCVLLLNVIQLSALLKQIMYTVTVHEIWASHSRGYEECCLLEITLVEELNG
jgi:hypothetical protein